MSFRQREQTRINLRHSVLLSLVRSCLLPLTRVEGHPTLLRLISRLPHVIREVLRQFAQPLRRIYEHLLK